MTQAFAGNENGDHVFASGRRVRHWTVPASAGHSVPMTSDRDVVDLLAELAVIDSTNPSLLPGAAGEGAVAARVHDWATAAGLGVDVLEATPGRPSLVVRSRPAGRGPVLPLT
jgi:hypothetical protein